MAVCYYPKKGQVSRKDHRGKNPGVELVLDKFSPVSVMKGVSKKHAPDAMTRRMTNFYGKTEADRVGPQPVTGGDYDEASSIGYAGATLPAGRLGDMD